MCISGYCLNFSFHDITLVLQVPINSLQMLNVSSFPVLFNTVKTVVFHLSHSQTVAYPNNPTPIISHSCYTTNLIIPCCTYAICLALFLHSPFQLSSPLYAVQILLQKCNSMIKSATYFSKYHTPVYPSPVPSIPFILVSTSALLSENSELQTG